MTTYYFISCNNKLFATCTDYNSVIIMCTNATMMRNLMKTMKYYHKKDGRVMNCYETMHVLTKTKVDTLQLSSYMGEEVNEKIGAMKLIYCNMMDRNEIFKMGILNNMRNSKIFHMMDYDYSLTTDILSIQGMYIEKAITNISEKNAIRYLDHML